ncbi:MAG: fasciclin domain-containing protein [Bacteroidia bacterium]|nr:fasciclin domain-containing protein [Nitrosopumilus sp.]
MKKYLLLFAAIVIAGTLQSCNNEENASEATQSTNATTTPVQGGQASVQDDVSQKNVVQIAIASPDHTTLVKAVQAANLVDALANNGPFTVFAPTDAAFAQVPSDALNNLMKPENKGQLEDVLYDHVYVGVIKTENIEAEKKITLFGGQVVTLNVENGKYTVNGANIIASIPASNGMVHVVDKVLLK